MKHLLLLLLTGCAPLILSAQLHPRPAALQFLGQQLDELGSARGLPRGDYGPTRLSRLADDLRWSPNKLAVSWVPISPAHGWGGAYGSTTYAYPYWPRRDTTVSLAIGTAGVLGARARVQVLNEERVVPLELSYYRDTSRQQTSRASWGVNFDGESYSGTVRAEGFQRSAMEGDREHYGQLVHRSAVDLGDRFQIAALGAITREGFHRDGMTEVEGYRRRLVGTLGGKYRGYGYGRGDLYAGTSIDYDRLVDGWRVTDRPEEVERTSDAIGFNQRVQYVVYPVNLEFQQRFDWSRGERLRYFPTAEVEAVPLEHYVALRLRAGRTTAFRDPVFTEEKYAERRPVSAQLGEHLNETFDFVAVDLRGQVWYEQLGYFAQYIHRDYRQRVGVVEAVDGLRSGLVDGESIRTLVGQLDFLHTNWRSHDNQFWAALNYRADEHAGSFRHRAWLRSGVLYHTGWDEDWALKFQTDLLWLDFDRNDYRLDVQAGVERGKIALVLAATNVLDTAVELDRESALPVNRFVEYGLRQFTLGLELRQ